MIYSLGSSSPGMYCDISSILHRYQYQLYYCSLIGIVVLLLLLLPLTFCIYTRAIYFPRSIRYTSCWALLITWILLFYKWNGSRDVRKHAAGHLPSDDSVCQRIYFIERTRTRQSHWMPRRSSDCPRVATHPKDRIEYRAPPHPNRYASDKHRTR